MSGRDGIVDLRQYTTHPGRRDELISLFDRYFVDGQEAAGMHVVGQFRDLDDPDRFVWLRAFDSMKARGDALPRFYGGDVWRAHRVAANATMADSDDALLLEPLVLGPAYPRFGSDRRPGLAHSVVSVVVAYLAAPTTYADHQLADEVAAELVGSGAELVAAFATHEAENNFPALPLRDEHVLVWVTRFPDDEAYANHRAALTASPTWHDDVCHRLAARSSRLPMQQLRLRPTDRSHLR
jgi:hypothetical protein